MIKATVVTVIASLSAVGALFFPTVTLGDIARALIG